MEITEVGGVFQPNSARCSSAQKTECNLVISVSGNKEISLSQYYVTHTSEESLQLYSFNLLPKIKPPPIRFHFVLIAMQ